MRPRLPIDAVLVAAAWVGWSAFWVAWGWGLSLVGALSPRYLGCGAAVLVAGVILWRWRSGAQFCLRVRGRRWRRGWPAAFLVLWLGATLGGILHAPSNVDALTYRLPRVLQWLEAGRWHWIETVHLRMNYSATATEWVSAPLVAVGSVRLLFIANALGYALLPGLVFVWLRGLGARGRVAWRWMWLAPTALVFALQAGSVGNDLSGAVYFLAAMVFAQRAANTRGASWLCLGAIALGLATNVKSSNLAWVPMALVLLVRAWRLLPADRGRAALAAILLGASVSAGPTLALNAVHAGHWSGDPANLTGVRPGPPLAALAGNTLLTTVQNLAPPFFPWAATWNRWNEATGVPRWHAGFGADAFPRFTLRLGEIPQEEWAGLGLLLVVLLAVEGATAWPARRPMAVHVRRALWAGAAGGLILGVMMGSEMPARLLAPFYLVLIAAVAVASSGRTLERGWRWRLPAGLAWAVALLAVVLTPARPLWPAERTWAWAQQRWPANERIARAAHVYSVYRDRADPLGPVRAGLKPGDRVVGFLATGDDSEWSLWLPRGARHVVHVPDLADPRARSADVLVVRGDAFWGDRAAEEAALAAADFRVDARYEIAVKAARPAERWLVVRRNAR